VTRVEGLTHPLDFLSPSVSNFFSKQSPIFRLTSNVAIMGAWGYGLLQSDPDLDHAAQLSEVIGVELYYPENPDEVRRTLDHGALSKTFDRYLAEKPPQTYAIVILAVLAMKLGAKIETKYMNILRGIYQSTKLFPKSKKQFKEGLDTYKNDGTPWDLHCPGVDEVAADPNSDAHLENARYESFVLSTPCLIL
jgi:hypothetical protein